MRLKILNRDSKDKNTFRDNMIRLCSIEGDTLVLGYGYLEPSVVDEILLDNIAQGFVNCENPKVIIIGSNQKYVTYPKEGGKNYNMYTSNYISLAAKIKAKVPKSEIRIFISKEKNYHKKIAVKLNEDSIIFSIIGSSNFSNRTFAVNAIKFSQEVDIVFWNSWKYNYENENCYDELDYDLYSDLRIEYSIDYEAELMIYKLIDEINTNKDLEEFSLEIRRENKDKLISIYEEYESKTTNKENLRNFRKYKSEFENIVNSNNKLEILYAIEKLNNDGGVNSIRTMKYYCNQVSNKNRFEFLYRLKEVLSE